MDEAQAKAVEKGIAVFLVYKPKSVHRCFY